MTRIWKPRAQRHPRGQPISFLKEVPQTRRLIALPYTCFFFFFLDINFIASDFRKLSTHPGHWNTLIRQVFIILMLTLHTYAYIYLRLLRLILNLFYWFIEKVPSTLTFPQEKPVLIWLKKSVNLPLSLLIENRQ